jgi:hypothetical protein
LTLPRQTADLTLFSILGSFRARCSFVNDRLQQILITDGAGEVAVNSKADSLMGEVKDFLSRYQVYTQNNFYGSLNSMLGGVSANDNVSKISGNVKLDVTVYNEGRFDFVWTYVDVAGVEAPVKNVALSFENGGLKCFTDNWQFYTVAESPVISREQAVELALNVSDSFALTSVDSDGANFTFSDFKVASVGDPAIVYLNFRDANSARTNDPFTLYPSWYVPLGFDKVYLEDATGLYVRLWATADLTVIAHFTPTP